MTQFYVTAGSKGRILPFLSLGFLLLGMLHPALGQSSGQPSSPVINAATVDLAAVIALHPAMRDFDYHSGKFVSRARTAPSGGLSAWKETEPERRRLKSLEQAMEAQAGHVNEELAEARAASGTSRPASRREYERLSQMNRDYQQQLADLAKRVLGGFPDQLLVDGQEATLRRIMDEVLWAVQSSAQQRQAALVLNVSPGGEFSFARDALQSPPLPLRRNPAEMLKEMQISSLADLEALVQQASGPDSPFGRRNLSPLPGAVCGGHFESVKDPEMLKTLIGEYYNHRRIFAGPFNALGAARPILSGSMNVMSVDITAEAISRLLELYRSRQAEREAIQAVLRQHIGP